MSGGHGKLGDGNTPLDFVVWFIRLVFDLKMQTTYLGNWGVSRALYLCSAYIGLFFILGHLIPHLGTFTFRWLLGTAPIWLPASLIIISWNAWTWYIQALFLSGRNPVLLEMKIPRDILKSPRAMEIAISSLSISSGETTFIHRGWKGQLRTYFSFEIASFGGQVHFFIWCWKNYRNVVETALYAQYPEIELVEVEDYASKFQYDPEIHSAFCTDWRRETYVEGPKTGSRNVDAYPIKTYIDFELDQDPKEENKIDPLAQVVEYFSSLKPNEQAWAQIVIRKAGNYDGVLLPKDMDHEWQDAVRAEINRVQFQATSRPKDPEGHGDPGSEDDRSQFPRPSESQKEQLVAMERNFGKFAFEVGMRGVYISSGDLHGPTYSGLRYLWRPFNNAQYRSQIKPKRWTNDFDYPWQDFQNLRLVNQTRRFLDAFRRRSWYTSPWKTPTFIMTNEELASLWHPPSGTVHAPGLERIPATKASAPSNLPR